MTKRRYGANEGSVAKVDPQGDQGRASETDLSSSRQRILESVPTGWLDRVLVATADAPLSSGEGAVVEAMVECLFAVLPTYAVGACFVGDSNGGRVGPLVLRRLAEGAARPTDGIDPTRIFPGSKYEHVTVLPGSYASSTL